jgi:cation:H+ antiporter
MTFELLLWQWALVFVVSATAVVGAGVVLAGRGDAIAYRTGMGGLFVGMLLMAAATSLPEIVTDSAAAAAGSPDLAIGDLFGSSMANMAILAVIDLLYRRSVWPAIGLAHARVAAVAIGLTTLVLLAILAPGLPRLGWVGLESLAILVAYVAAAAWARGAHGTDGGGASADELLNPVGWQDHRPGSLRRDLLAFAAAALVILVAAPFVAFSAQGIAEATGFAESFVGVTLLAVATSLPELVASLSAVRIGAHDLAVGNLFGSNAFNMTIVVFIDAAYLPGPILGAVSMNQLIPGIGAILLMAIALGAIVHGSDTRLRRGEPDAVLLLAAYLGLLFLTWAGGASA